MAKEFWVTLPVKDLQRSIKFFTSIGFEHRTTASVDESIAQMKVDQTNGIINLIEQTAFEQIVHRNTAPVRHEYEVQLSIDAEEKKDVSLIANKVKKAGGTVFSEPQQKGGAFGCGFLDLDGHRWNIIFRNNLPIIKSYFDGQDSHDHLGQDGD